MKRQRDTYQEITDKIIAAFETGCAPWVKPWRSSGRVGGLGSASPINAVSKRAYRGVNVILLWMASDAAGYTSNVWLTFKQAKALGGSVIAGQKATEIVFVKPLTYADKNADGSPKLDGDGNAIEKRFNMLRTYYVFNTEQCDGLPERIVGKPAEVAPTADLTSAEDASFDAWAKATGAHISHGSDQACYWPASDHISMPDRKAFNTSQHYAATLLHELGHWTGDAKRLNRNLRGRFGDAEYAAEELIAELTAAFLCAEHGIDGDLRHPGYIKSWLEVLKQDKRAIVTASAAATKAADYILKASPIAGREEPAEELREAA